jgi:hypothetical protein
MAKENAKKSVENNENDCKCSCGCGCCCGCKGKFVKFIVLLIVFLAGIGCGCMICCCGGCKGYRHHRFPAPMAMAKHRMMPRNNVIVIRTDGDEVVPEVAKAGPDLQNFSDEQAQPEAPEAEAHQEAPEAEAPVAE